MVMHAKISKPLRLIGLIALLATLAIAGVPHELKLGEKASAQQVMDNFRYIDSMNTQLKMELQKAQSALIDQGVDLKSLKGKIENNSDSLAIATLRNQVQSKIDTSLSKNFIRRSEPNGFQVTGSAPSGPSLVWQPSGTLSIFNGTYPGISFSTGGISIGDAFGPFELNINTENQLSIGMGGRFNTIAMTTDGRDVHFPNSIYSEGTLFAQSINATGDIDVDGKIIVQSKQIAPDYVFEPTYTLMPLPELARFVQTNKHLPEVPEAASIASSGVDVGSMNLLLLKKVEELTLHLINQNRRIDSLQVMIHSR